MAITRGELHAASEPDQAEDAMTSQGEMPRVGRLQQAMSVALLVGALVFNLAVVASVIYMLVR